MTVKYRNDIYRTYRIIVIWAKKALEYLIFIYFEHFPKLFVCLFFLSIWLQWWDVWRRIKACQFICFDLSDTHVSTSALHDVLCLLHTFVKILCKQQLWKILICYSRNWPSPHATHLDLIRSIQILNSYTLPVKSIEYTLLGY